MGEPTMGTLRGTGNVAHAHGGDHGRWTDAHAQVDHDRVCYVNSSRREKFGDPCPVFRYVPHELLSPTATVTVTSVRGPVRQSVDFTQLLLYEVNELLSPAPRTRGCARSSQRSSPP